MTTGGSYELGADIAIGDWVSPTVSADFTLDGKGYTLSGMNVTEAVGTGNTGVSGSEYSLYHAGLIGNATANITLQNLTVTGATVAPTKVTGAPENYEYTNGLSSAAVLIGTSTSGKTVTLKNVSVTDSTVTGVTKLGAFVGQNNSTLNITNCEVSGCTITGEYNYAPVAGYSSKTAVITAAGLKLSNNTMTFQKVDEDFQAFIDADGSTDTVSPDYAVETGDNKRLWATSSDYYVVEDGATASTISGYTEGYTMKRVAVTIADTFACSIDGAYYATLAGAVTAATSGDTIKLLEDVTADITIPAGKTLTLDLNGHKITNVSDHTITNNGTLTITDSSAAKTGAVDNITHGKAALFNNGTATLNGGLISRSADKGTGPSFGGNNANGNSWYTIVNHGTMTINAGAAISNAGTYSSMIDNGWASPAQNTNKTEATLTVNGGTFTGGLYSLKNDDYGVMYVYGGEYSGTNSGTFLNWNKLTIHSGVFSAGKNGIVLYAAYDSSLSTVNHTAYENSQTTINDGSFSGALFVDTGAKVSITGGYFTSDPTAYVASGKIAQATTKTGYIFEVVGKSNASVEVALAPPEIKAQTGATDAEKAAVTALQKFIGVGGLEGAAGKEAQNVTTTAEQGAAALGGSATAANTKIYEQPYLAIEVTGATAASEHEPATLTVNIVPMVKTVASTAADAEDIVTSDDGKNAVQIGGAKKLTVTTPVTIVLSIPEAMATETATSSGTYKPMNIKHIKENGDIYYYIAAVTKETALEDTTIYLATFTVTHGFSAFTLQAADTRALAVTYDSNGGSAITGSPITYSITDVGSTLPVPTKAGYSFDGWKLEGLTGTYKTLPDFWSDKTWTSTKTITATAQFSAIPVGGGSSYTLTFEVNGGGKLAAVTKSAGTTVDLAAYKPVRDGYTFVGWCSDKELTKAVTSVRLDQNVTVYAKWAKAVPFSDVKDDAYYKAAVDWAVERGVTEGTSPTTFSPDGICTRAQAVTFLWRAYGSPEPSNVSNPFADVKADAYYYKAVLWAVEKGVTAGTTTTTFSPDATVTRAQAVSFLWRSAGSPAQTAANPFADVAGDAYYASAVLWAVKEGVTAGTSTATFSPNEGCTRAQIVSFLYRYFVK